MDNSFGSLSHGVVLLPELRTIHLELAKLMDEIDQLVREPILDEVIFSLLAARFFSFLCS